MQADLNLCRKCAYYLAPYSDIRTAFEYAPEDVVQVHECVWVWSVAAKFQGYSIYTMAVSNSDGEHQFFAQVPDRCPYQLEHYMAGASDGTLPSDMT